MTNWKAQDKDDNGEDAFIFWEEISSLNEKIWLVFELDSHEFYLLGPTFEPDIAYMPKNWIVV